MPAEEQGAARQNIVFATGAADPLAAVGDDRRFAAITCGPENVQAFNARLRDELPEFHAFARELHRLGLIDGLRGARIGPVGGLGQGGVVPVLSDASESRLAAKGRA